MPTVPFGDRTPRLDPSVFVAPTAWITGDVTVGAEASFFFGAVARGDILPVQVGARTNVQENALLHTSTGLTPCIVGADVTIGHGTIVHGCTVGNRCILGMNAVILDGATIGDDCIIGAQALVPMNMRIPPRSLVLGVPAKVVRTLTDAEVASILENAQHYVETSREYLRQLAKR